MIKFKAYVGKWLITTINEKLLDLRKKSIIKRIIKFYAFNYKKFTIKVSYEQNKHWLMSKLEELLLLGDEENQIKNEKSLKLLNKKKLIELKEIKDMLNLTYEDAIKAFYKSDYFKQKFKEDKRVIELNNNFIKIMDISLLEPNGFIRFLETRKGNKRKEE